MALRYISLVMLVIWHVYWKIESGKTEKSKPMTKKPSLTDHLAKLYVAVPTLLCIFQLAGMEILTFGPSSVVSVAGFVVFLCGVFISVWARATLRDNWTGASEYQVKKEHNLVTDGPYAYIRHPIYLALFLVFTGIQIQVQSLLVFPMAVYMAFWSYYNGKREEILLGQYFGQEYVRYKRTSKMLIPFIY